MDGRMGQNEEETSEWRDGSVNGRRRRDRWVGRGGRRNEGKDGWVGWWAAGWVGGQLG